MPTPNRKSRFAPLTGALTGALLLTSALCLPGARAQTTTAPSTDTTPAPPVIAAPPDTTTPPPAPPVDNASPTTAPMPSETTTTPSESATPASVPQEETPHKSRFRIGPTIGLFLPTDSKTRDRFGSSWFSIGLGLGPVSGITNKGAIGFDINLLYQKHDDNHALLVPIGVGYRVALINTTRPDGSRVNTVPYAGVTADYYLVNFKSNPEKIDGTYGAGGGSAILGINFGDTANIEARYQFASKVRGFDFSGLNLTAGYRF